MSCDNVYGSETTFARVQDSVKPLLLKPVYYVLLVEILEIADLFVENGRSVGFRDAQKVEEVGERKVGDEAKADHVQLEFEEVG